MRPQQLPTRPRLRPAHRRGLLGRGLRRASAVLLALALSGCAWSAWVPGESNWNPDVVVDPARLSTNLPLDSTYVETLGCYGNVCDKRFRVIAPRAGTLTVRALFEMQSNDQQGRLLLESPSKILGQANTGRGPRTDVSPLIVRASVAKGTYFVLIQGIGGGAPIPYELTATLSRESVTDAVLSEVTPEPENLALTEVTAAANATPGAEDPERPEDATPHRLVKFDRGVVGGGGYDAAVRLTGNDTFAFPSLARPGEIAPGTPLLGPDDRQIRRFLAEALQGKGFRQAEGDAPPDLMVDFTTGDKTRALVAAPLLAFYGLVDRPYSRGRLVVDIVDRRTDRLAWTAWTTYAAGPGAIEPEQTAEELRRAVTEALTGFPPPTPRDRTRAP